MAYNIKLTVAYDGTAYHGWQKTKEGPSIEESLSNILVQILQEEVKLNAASRTDAGVHADHQVISFKTEKTIIDCDRLFMSLNRLLPKDIVVISVKEASKSFHATLDCISKEYRYFVCYDKIQLPKERLYSWHFPYELDIQKMNEAIEHIIGTKDFSVFCNFKKNAKYSHYVREVTDISIEKMDMRNLCIIVKGKNFLYKMVRNIVGTLLYVGRGKISPQDVKDIVNSYDRTKAGVTAAAHGLCLHKLFYE